MARSRLDLIHRSSEGIQKSTDSRIGSTLEKLAQIDLFTLARKDWKQLASESGLSYSRFHHIFKENVGVPPGHYIKLARLLKAKQLLDHRFVPIKEVMFSVGFTDASHFCRDFKALVGLSPRRYRDQQSKKKK